MISPSHDLIVLETRFPPFPYLLSLFIPRVAFVHVPSITFVISTLHDNPSIATDIVNIAERERFELSVGEQTLQLAVAFCIGV